MNLTKEKLEEYKKSAAKGALSRKKTIDKEKLKQYIENNNQAEACELEGIGKSRLRTICREHGLFWKRDGVLDFVPGQIFTNLTIMGLDHKDKKEGRIYKCSCVCGKEILADHSDLTAKRTKSCGCLKGKMRRAEGDIVAKSHIGEKYGRLTVISFARKQEGNGNIKIYYQCKCDCGNITERPYAEIIGKHRISCGCWLKEIRSEIGSKTFKNHKKNQFYNWYFIKNGENIKCRSSYEVIYANWLIDNNIEFEYEPKTFILSNKMRYTPDFHLIKDDIYAEIKGLDRGNQEENRRVFVKDGYKLELLKWHNLVEKCGYPFKCPGSHTNQAKRLCMKTEDYLAQKFYKTAKPYAKVIKIPKTIVNSLLGEESVNSTITDLSLTN